MREMQKIQYKILDEDTCPDCKAKLVFNTDETYCPKCGLVVDPNPISFGIDWDNWDNDFDENSRAGKPARYIDGDVTKSRPTNF